MQFRTWLTFVNLGAFISALLVLELLPQYAAFAFYALVAWMLVSLVLLYRPGGSRTGGPSATTGITVSPDAPLASTTQPQHASSFGFCIYCAAPIEPGTARCPACKHVLPHLA
ncbi:MAG TPA: hypothetical protein VMG14_08425 [Thermoplasmata archaeon]|nr:hypothetical protein [Thermoplasmata archaeon]